MYVCVCVCVCVYIHTTIHIHANIIIYMYVAFFTAFARSFDVLTDPFMGYLTDSARTRWGRRKPFIFIGAPLFALMTILVYIYMYVCIVCIYFIYVCIYIYMYVCMYV